MKKEVKRLVAGLLKTGLAFTADDLSDALWLASRLPASSQRRERESETTDESKREGEQGNEKQEKGQGKSQETSGRGGRLHSLHAPRAAGSSGAGAPGTAMRTGGASALPEGQRIIRAVRPLMRRGPSRNRFVLDEEATIKRIADERVWDPVLRPALDRRVKLCVVVDA